MSKVIIDIDTAKRIKTALNSYADILQSEILDCIKEGEDLNEFKEICSDDMNETLHLVDVLEIEIFKNE